jgi:serine/threonine-protein kinase
VCYEKRFVAFAPGYLLAPNLRLSRMLAEGGMGSVWVADHLGLKTRVAIKFISEASASDESMKIRFSREATAAAQIKSPHVVQIFDHGVVDGQVPYIVMELLEGESLGDRLDRLGPLETREVASILTQLCRAVARAHALGIVHRDIKPDNVFLTDSDGDLFVKVLDFGIAKREADDALSMTSTGMAVGTPHYMSPEQIVSAKNVTSATDLWAIGAVAYRSLTGQLPFQGESYGALCIMINTGEFARPTSLRPDLPAAIDAWFARALDRDPKRRFASAKELADEFLVAAGFGRGQAVSVPSRLPPPSSQGSRPAAAHATPSTGGSGTLTATPSFSSSPRSSDGRGTGPSIQGAAVTGGYGVPARRRRTSAVLAASIFVVGAALAGVWTLTRSKPPAQVDTAMAGRPAPSLEPAPVPDPPPPVAAPPAEPPAAPTHDPNDLIDIPRLRVEPLGIAPPARGPAPPARTAPRQPAKNPRSAREGSRPGGSASPAPTEIDHGF